MTDRFVTVGDDLRLPASVRTKLVSEPELKAASVAAGRAVFATLAPAATYTYELAPDGTKRIKTETKGGVTMTYTYDDANGGRVATQSDGTTTWTFSYDADSLITGVAA
jgi:YD repeat-containing protein